MDLINHIASKCLATIAEGDETNNGTIGVPCWKLTVCTLYMAQVAAQRAITAVCYFRD